MTKNNLNKLKDRKLFLKGRLLNYGTVVFNDEVDRYIILNMASEERGILTVIETWGL